MREKTTRREVLNWAGAAFALAPAFAGLPQPLVSLHVLSRSSGRMLKVNHRLPMHNPGLRSRCVAGQLRAKIRFAGALERRRLHAAHPAALEMVDDRLFGQGPRVWNSAISTAKRRSSRGTGRLHSSSIRRVLAQEHCEHKQGRGAAA